LLGRDAGYLAEDTRAAAGLMQSHPSAGVRQAAASVLRRTRSDEVPSLLVSGWKGAAPSARTEILSLLLNREAWAQSLLAAISKGEILASEIPMAERQRLLQH